MPPTQIFLGFPAGSDGKESVCNVGDPGLIPGFEVGSQETPGVTEKFGLGIQNEAGQRQ